MKRILFCYLLFSAVSSGAAGPSSTPASVTKETDLVIVTLRPEAEQRLRLETAHVEMQTLGATRLFAGEVVKPLAKDGSPIAPVLGGTLDELLRLADLQASADGRILQAKVQRDAAQIALERAQKVLNAEAGSVRSVDEAKAALALAEAALETAHAQRALLGTAVEKVSDVQRLWVRVAIYSGEASLLDATSDASMRLLAGHSGHNVVRFVKGPPTANALTQTVDWYYELPSPAQQRPGERVAVEIQTSGSKEPALVVPFQAVLHDIHGGEWVYEKLPGHRYARRRIQVQRLSGKLAVLATGPKPGIEVVTAGAAELFGTEFMTGK